MDIRNVDEYLAAHERLDHLVTSLDMDYMISSEFPVDEMEIIAEAIIDFQVENDMVTECCGHPYATADCPLCCKNIEDIDFDDERSGYEK